MKTSLEKFVLEFVADSRKVLGEFFQANGDEVLRVGVILAERLKDGGKVVFFGNGGSAADAQHLAAEFVGRCFFEREPLRALALTTDTSCLTAVGNDYGFDEIFARQARALVDAGDVAVGLSTSGKSANVLKGLAEARGLGALTLGFGGGDGGSLGDFCDHLFVVPSSSTQIIQQVHITLGHLLCGVVEHWLDRDKGDIPQGDGFL